MEAVSDHARDQHPGPPLVITPPCGVSAAAESSTSKPSLYPRDPHGRGCDGGGSEGYSNKVDLMQLGCLILRISVGYFPLADVRGIVAMI